MRPCSSTHYIRLDFLEQVVLYEVRRLAAFAGEYGASFLKTILGQSAKKNQNDRGFLKPHKDTPHGFAGELLLVMRYKQFKQIGAISRPVDSFRSAYRVR